jgi:hypothetical protein
MEQALRRGFYDNAEDAEHRALERRDVLYSVRTGTFDPPLPQLQPIDHSGVGNETTP